MANAQTKSAQAISPGKKAWETRKARAAEKAAPPKPKAKLAPPDPIKLPKEAKAVSIEEMMVRTVVLVVTVNAIGNRRKVDTASLDITDVETEEELNKDWLGVTTKLMKAPELKQITSLGNSAKAFVKHYALPYGLKPGIYLLPREFSEPVNDGLTDFQQKLNPLVDGLAKRLPEYKKQAKKEQGPQFNEDRFPTAEQIRDAFAISWRYLFVDSARGLSKEVYEQEKKKTEQQWAEAREAMTTMLRMQMSKLVDHMVDRLSPNEHGDQKQFMASSLQKLNEWLTLFDPKNVGGDVQLKALVERAKSIMTKADADSLRGDDTVRGYVLQGFENIKNALDPLIVNKPHRAIRLVD